MRRRYDKEIPLPQHHQPYRFFVSVHCEPHEVDAAGYALSLIVSAVPGYGVGACGLITVNEPANLPAKWIVNRDSNRGGLRQRILNRSFLHKGVRGALVKEKGVGGSCKIATLAAVFAFVDNLNGVAPRKEFTV